jgi:putative Ca2+/H+ antiporter (TMEM165/GDT1 family)
MRSFPQARAESRFVDISPHLAYGIDWRLFASTFAVIFLAEIPDKTALAAVLLATGNRPLPVFVGVAAAFIIQSVVAVSFGSVISMFPREGIRLLAGALFLCFAVAMWMRGRGPAEEAEADAAPRGTSAWSVTWKAFLVIFIAEWGDLTQLASAALAAKYAQPITIFTASTLALWSVSAIAVFVGHKLKAHINPRLMQRVAAIVFAVLGVLMLCGVSLSGG